SLFEVLLPDGHKLWPDWLRRIDTLLEDEAVIEAVAQALEARWPQSRRRGRPGTPAEIVLRMLVLKHLFDWSYDELEREVRANLVYRAFTHIDAAEVPDAKTILKIARVLGPDAVQQLHQRVVDVAKRAGVTHGRPYVAEVGQEFMTEYDRRDSRLRVIYDNGTESNVLMRSLERALHRDSAGRRITDLSAGPLFADDTEEGDAASGTIYVL